MPQKINIKRYPPRCITNQSTESQGQKKKNILKVMKDKQINTGK